MRRLLCALFPMLASFLTVPAFAQNAEEESSPAELRLEMDAFKYNYVNTTTKFDPDNAPALPRVTNKAHQWRTSDVTFRLRARLEHAVLGMTLENQSDAVSAVRLGWAFDKTWEAGIDAGLLRNVLDREAGNDTRDVESTRYSLYPYVKYRVVLDELVEHLGMELQGTLGMTFVNEDSETFVSGTVTDNSAKGWTYGGGAQVQFTYPIVDNIVLLPRLTVRYEQGKPKTEISNVNGKQEYNQTSVVFAPLAVRLIF